MTQFARRGQALLRLSVRRRHRGSFYHSFSLGVLLLNHRLIDCTCRHVYMAHSIIWKFRGYLAPWNLELIVGDYILFLLV